MSKRLKRKRSSLFPELPATDSLMTLYSRRVREMQKGYPGQELEKLCASGMMRVFEENLFISLTGLRHTFNVQEFLIAADTLIERGTERIVDSVFMLKPTVEAMGWNASVVMKLRPDTSATSEQLEKAFASGWFKTLELNERTIKDEEEVEIRYLRALENTFVACASICVLYITTLYSYSSKEMLQSSVETMFSRFAPDMISSLERAVVKVSNGKTPQDRLREELGSRHDDPAAELRKLIK